MTARDNREAFLNVAAQLLGKEPGRWPNITTSELAILDELVALQQQNKALAACRHRSDLLTSACDQLREAAAVFRDYERQHVAKAQQAKDAFTKGRNLEGPDLVEIPDRMAKAKRNGDLATGIEAFLKFVETPQ
ncbi:hypothetical protein W2_gp041c [Caulobacter phage W2]|uniref:Uncharacterized protein n=1 Tax=Caulobacter phage TMCBR4 TaxID=3028191 RepID=A0AAE9ZLE3_9CAUD|nr:hypothetical protein TMCBR4_gp042c [Caulobacter phage TMCBR4]WDS38409.1 hypothetical protein W2_gp041c [Caulobacter phage W2]